MLNQVLEQLERDFERVLESETTTNQESPSVGRLLEGKTMESSWTLCRKMERSIEFVV